MLMTGREDWPTFDRQQRKAFPQTRTERQLDPRSQSLAEKSAECEYELFIHHG